MNPAKLKKLQAPIKELYKKSPDSALIKLRAESNGGEGLSCKLETHQNIIEAGLHPATGGSGLEACSGDMLLEALVACAGVTLKAVATAFDKELTRSKVVAEGSLDFRGTLGVAKEAPVGFDKITLTFDIAGNATNEELKKIVEVTERYCVVLQTLKCTPKIDMIISN
jgi:uncharacterized OsmC-like protein